MKSVSVGGFVFFSLFPNEFGTRERKRNKWGGGGGEGGEARPSSVFLQLVPKTNIFSFVCVCVLLH